MADTSTEVFMQQIEHIIGYSFKDRTLLSKAMRSIGAIPHSQLSKYPPSNPDSCVLSKAPLDLVGQTALQAVGWQLFWDSKNLKNVTWKSVTAFIERLRMMIEEVTMIEVAKKYGLYLSFRGEGRVAPRVRAIFGAVWLDSEKNLEQVKHVFLKLGVMVHNHKFN